jgi:hypothetical protein
MARPARAGEASRPAAGRRRRDAACAGGQGLRHSPGVGAGGRACRLRRTASTRPAAAAATNANIRNFSSAAGSSLLAGHGRAGSSLLAGHGRAGSSLLAGHGKGVTRGDARPARCQHSSCLRVSAESESVRGAVTRSPGGAARPALPAAGLASPVNSKCRACGTLLETARSRPCSDLFSHAWRSHRRPLPSGCPLPSPHLAGAPLRTVPEYELRMRRNAKLRAWREQEQPIEDRAPGIQRGARAKPRPGPTDSVFRSDGCLRSVDDGCLRFIDRPLICICLLLPPCPFCLLPCAAPLPPLACRLGPATPSAKRRKNDTSNRLSLRPATRGFPGPGPARLARASRARQPCARDGCRACSHALPRVRNRNAI